MSTIALDTENTDQVDAQEQKALNEKVKKNLLYLGIFSIVMLFGAITSGYIVSQGDRPWVHMKMPSAFITSTIIIVLSSLALFVAGKASRGGNWSLTRIMLGLALLLGIGFGVLQYQGWGQLVAGGNHLVGNLEHVNGVYGEDYTIVFQGETLVMENGEFYMPSDELRAKPLKGRLEGQFNAASSYLYFLTGLHVAHLLGGLLYLLVVFIASFSTVRHERSILKIKLGSIYWHFLGGLWIYLFLFLFFIR